MAATRPASPALRRRYDERQSQLIRQAARVFARRGYDQTSMQELAQELGIAAGGLYHYFDGKEELLIGVCDQIMEPLLERTRAVFEGGGPPEVQLRQLVRLWVAHVVEHRDHMLVFQQERHLIARGAQWRGVRATRKGFEKIVEDVLKAVPNAGLLRAVDDRLALYALLGMVNHTAQWYRPRGPLDPRQIADGYVDLLLASPADHIRKTP